MQQNKQRSCASWESIGSLFVFIHLKSLMCSPDNDCYSVDGIKIKTVNRALITGRGNVPTNSYCLKTLGTVPIGHLTSQIYSKKWISLLCKGVVPMITLMNLFPSIFVANERRYFDGNFVTYPDRIKVHLASLMGTRPKHWSQVVLVMANRNKPGNIVET